MSSAAVANGFAAEAAALAAGLEKPAVNPEIESRDAPPALQHQITSIKERYDQEREKRLRPDGREQFLDALSSDKYRHYASDIWVDKDHPPSRLTLRDGTHTRILIIGGGFGALIFAARSTQVGFSPEDITLVEAAGGFGGAWWWNRYPGLMCDVESYIYMPLLEETNYIPKHKYAYGPELREHANRIAKHFTLDTRAAFQHEVQTLTWSESEKHWQVEVLDLLTHKSVTVTADFVQVSPGLLHRPRLIDMPGMDEFKGHSFHTSRWDYAYTGGSPEDPSMTNLRDKRVGIIGTGATAVQAVPHLAKWAKELYVFQRTPSSVDERGQQRTDPDTFVKSVGAQPGWQSERSRNFNAFIGNTDPKPEINLVNDAWSLSPSYSALIGGGPGKVDMANVTEHVATLHDMDAVRTSRIRARVDTIVHDTATATALKAWYPTWCKRPTFHDDYLPSFNAPHVHLIDTNGRGIDRISASGVVANAHTYDLDLLIFGTGYNLETSLSPTRRANVDARGIAGLSLDDKWATNLATLHGLTSRGFPNLFFSGPSQAAVSANFTSVLDVLGTHAAHIIASAVQHVDPRGKVVVQPTAAAEAAWSAEIMSGVFAFAAMAGCTPGYLNGEGSADRKSHEEKMRSARGAVWAGGANGFTALLEKWRADGMPGLEITGV